MNGRQQIQPRQPRQNVNTQMVSIKQENDGFNVDTQQLKLILEDPSKFFGTKDPSSTFKDEIISLAKIEKQTEIVYIQNPDPKENSLKLKIEGRNDSGSDITFILNEIAKQLKLKITEIDELNIREAQNSKSKFKGTRINLSFETPGMKNLSNYPVGILQTDEMKILLGSELQLKMKTCKMI
jgi:hypothetical protein